MTTCEEDDFPCQNANYDEFDDIARKELSNPIDVNMLVNKSYFCMQIPVDDEFIVGDLNYKLFLKTLRDHSGLYHLWIDHADCDDHGTYTMLCVYVGKGAAELRVTSHIKSKWPSAVALYVTFNKLDNRLAKYYEQLFLDTYEFHLNTAENTGSKRLYAVWDEERHHIGTHQNEASALSNMQSELDW